MDYTKLAELLFPEGGRTAEYYEELYPKRQGTVTRLGPSPTGFIHLGNLYGALADERLAHTDNGVFYLRIEDTDDKRYVEGAVDMIIDSLAYFGISFDEGVAPDGESGAYGPYYQSGRKEIYQTYARSLVSKGMAYPCFMTEEEITAIREYQEANKLDPGIYGEFAKCRDMSAEEVAEKLEQGAPYVLRLRSQGRGREITVRDGIRGDLTMPENDQDVVILKTNGMPTYHFAHVIDDHLMRTSHVVRGAEWLSSLPIHYELFHALGFELPIYCHTGQLMKTDENGNKRKLSKRRDPELSLDYYRQHGYMPDAVMEYLMTLLNSNYEEWRAENPELPREDFPFSLEKMNPAGSLVDMDKLDDISKDVLVRKPSKEIYNFLKQWASEYAPEYADRLDDEPYWMKVLDLDRTGDKPRKDLVNAPQIMEYTNYFFEYVKQDGYPAECDGDVSEILTRYLDTYDHTDDQSAWFEKIRCIADDMGYARKPKDYKKHPEEYKGHVGHVSTVIRIALTGRASSPDVWEIQHILGEEKTRERIKEEVR